jgi:protein-S-isoprenylcysteine O-methyltransferase Ste14
VAQVVLLAAVALSALVGWAWPNGVEPVALGIGIAVMVAGAVLLVSGSAALGPAYSPFPAPRERGRLTEHSVYAYVRHPLYGGGILLAAGWSLIFASLVGGVLTLVFAVVSDLKARLEERWLEKHYPGYAAYRERTRRRFVPGVY